MTERLRDLTDPGDPALAQLAQLVRAASDLEPPPGAQERIRGALNERRRAPRRLRHLVLVSLVLLVVLPMAFAGVRKLAARRRSAPPSTAAVSVEDARPVPVHPAHGVAPVAASIPPPTSIPAPAAESTMRALVTSRSTDEAAAPAVSLRPADAAGPARAAEQIIAASAAPSASRRAPVLPALDTAAPARDPAIAPVAPRPPGPLADPSRAVATDTAVDAPRSAGGAPEPGARLVSVTRAPPGRPQPAAEDAALVLGALRALRNGHDGRAALRQLDDYRARFPAGDLVEAALALSIEARAALGDAAVVALAEQYLQQFPHGRFRALAERAQRSFHVR